jgi:hypothetical protein
MIDWNKKEEVVTPLYSWNKQLGGKYRDRKLRAGWLGVNSQSSSP